MAQTFSCFVTGCLLNFQPPYDVISLGVMNLRYLSPHPVFLSFVEAKVIQDVPHEDRVVEVIQAVLNSQTDPVRLNVFQHETYCRDRKSIDLAHCADCIEFVEHDLGVAPEHFLQVKDGTVPIECIRTLIS